MKKKTLLSPDIYKTEPLISEKMTVGDVAASLRKFIERHYRGNVLFSKQNCNESDRILFDDYDFAIMIKSVIKELTLEHTCMISFSSTNGSFIIRFDAHKETRISPAVIRRLCAEGERLGINVSANEACVLLSVPTRSLAATAVYEGDELKFYRVLYAVFAEDCSAAE